ncbi:uncharacterized protein LOC110110382 isoform X3 [Dendrobium catenatum]|uniref:uncharacterized protein LOC110110382 isoform X3 n=1 Tax=Dendrobium catenatum TaxID=906689 RepID=UPI0010A08EF8|nr:uncharacterized protein LOC110110382 isoform X3 [Dendrobium catenatum]
MSTKRTKWHPPPPPTPRILNFPRRSRLLRPEKHRAKLPVATKPNLEALMRQESRRCRGEERRAKVEESYSSPSGEITRDSAEDKWKFQADVLRAECNFLRMEREVALRKLDRNRVQMESALTSLMETMISGRKKIDGRCGNAPMALDEEIEEILAKLEEIHGGFRWTKLKVGRSGGNFDRCASSLRRRLATMEEVEKLRMKMEGLSKGMMERMEEHGLLSLSFESSPSAAAAEAGRGNARHGLFDKEVRAVADRRRPLRQTEELGSVKQLETIGVGRCCNCKNLVDKIAQQVMAEAEQCGEMQAMLDKVKTDMEELRSSRDHWEHRALSSELKFRSLHSQMLEWKKRALESEKIAKELGRAEASSLPTLSDQLDSEICRLKQLKIREKQRKSLEFQSVKEKHVVVCQRRSPFQEIGNLPSKNSTARMFR